MTLLAFEVDAALHVTEVWKGEGVTRGVHLLDLFDTGAAPAAVAFFAELSDLGVAIGQSFPVSGKPLRFSACRRGESSLVVAASHHSVAIAWLATIGDPRARLLRRLLETLATADAEETHRLYGELTQLNNELTTLHRELAIRTRDLERANILLEQQAVELRRLNEEKNRFIGIAAHDLRSPIGSILVFTESILEIARDPEAVGLAKEIIALSRGMATLVDEILNVSAIESGTFRLERSAVDLNEAAAHAIAMHHHHAARKSIELSLVRTPAAAVVQADAGKIDQVLNNLITNALKFSYPGESVEVTVATDAEGCAVSVRDHGVGIAPDEQARLFLPFEKLSAKSTAGEPNTGLGLAIVRRIVDAHGGRIEVTSVPGSGSTFSVWLPAAPTEDDQAVDSAGSSSPATPATGRIR